MTKTTLERGGSSLAAAFLSGRPPDADGGSAEELEAALEKAVAAGRAAWPGIDLAPEEVAAYLGERCDPAEPPMAALAALHVSDLYLACACVAGSAAAIAALEEQHLTRVAQVACRFDPSPGFGDEITQRVRIALLVGREDGQGQPEPKIALYRGKAALSNWVTVVATRTAINHHRQEAPMTELDELLDVASAESPELELLRRRHLGDFRRLMRDALAEALADLTPEARNLLRWHLVENLSLRKIAVLRGSNVSAISREYARIRALIRDRIVELVKTRTGLPVRELDSLMTVLISRISLSGGLSIAAASRRE
jgi:RNA polymerase sigma-70 factor (ECF subfamily)